MDGMHLQNKQSPTVAPPLLTPIVSQDNQTAPHTLEINNTAVSTLIPENVKTTSVKTARVNKSKIPVANDIQKKNSLPSRLVDSLVKGVSKALIVFSKKKDEAAERNAIDNFHIDGLGSTPNIGKEKSIDHKTSDKTTELSRTPDKQIVNHFLPQLKNTIEKGNLQEFKSILVQLSKNGNKGEASQCIKNMLAEYGENALSHHFKGDKDDSDKLAPFQQFNRNNYNKLMNFMSKVYGEKYSNLYEHTDGFFQGIDSARLTINGVKEIITSLNEKGHFKGDCLLCDGTGHQEEIAQATAKARKQKFVPNPSALPAQIKNSLEKMGKLDGPQRCMFIVRNYSGHMTPIMLEKTKDGNYNAVISDSTGKPSYTDPIVDDLNKIFKDKKLSKKLNIYSLNSGRQTDESNCGIFAIRDIVKMSKIENLTGWIAQNNTLEPGGENRKNFNILPTSMMKTVQSNSANEDYTKVIDQRAKSNNDEKLSGELKQYVTYMADKQVLSVIGRVAPSVKPTNSKIAQAFLKYENELMCNLVVKEDIPD